MAGKIKTNTVQIGDSSTATDNFVLKTNVDGTLTLARGNDGATTQDILIVQTTGALTSLNTPKVWGVFNGELTGTNAPLSGVGIDTVTRNSEGQYTVNFTTPFNDTNYCVILTGEWDDSWASPYARGMGIRNKLVGSVDIRAGYYTSGNNPDDFPTINITIYSE